jgi:hypothetical protein
MEDNFHELEIRVPEEEIKATKPLGDHPQGYMILTSDGWVSILTTAGSGDRQKAASLEDKGRLWDQMFAYAGKYRTDVDKFNFDVDVAYIPNYDNLKLVRNFRLEGDRLYIVTGWTQDPNGPGERRGINLYERVK